MAERDQPWPFPGKRNEQLRTLAAKVDADVAAWRERIETLICDAINSREEADVAAVNAALAQVVAVRT